MSVLKNYWIGIFSALAIGACWLILHKSFITHHPHPSEAVGITFIKSLGYAFTIFFATRFLRKRWNRPKLEFWVLCLALSFSFCAIYDANETKNKAQQLANFKRETIRLAENLSNDPTAQMPQPQYTAAELGDFSKVLTITREFVEIYKQIDIDVLTAGARLADTLHPENLCKDGYILAAKKDTGYFLDTLDNCEKRYKDAIDFLSTRMKEALPGKNGSTEAAFKKFEEGKANMSKLVFDYFLAMRVRAQSMNDILNFLSSKPGGFIESNGTLAFKTEQDCAVFNSLVRELNINIEKELLMGNQLSNAGQRDNTGSSQLPLLIARQSPGVSRS